MWRASSLVECINSVARMHQGRHRKMTQGLLDLKWLYWNLHQFRAGHRKNQTPYGLLGLKLLALSFWEFLRMTQEELRNNCPLQMMCVRWSEMSLLPDVKSDHESRTDFVGRVSSMPRRTADCR